MKQRELAELIRFNLLGIIPTREDSLESFILCAKRALFRAVALSQKKKPCFKKLGLKIYAPIERKKLEPALKQFYERFGCNLDWVPGYYADLHGCYGQCKTITQYIFYEGIGRLDHWHQISLPIFFISKELIKSTFTISMHELVHVARARFSKTSYEEYLAYCIAENIEPPIRINNRKLFDKTTSKLKEMYGNLAEYILLRLDEDEALQIANADRNKIKALLSSLGLRTVLFEFKGIV